MRPQNITAVKANDSALSINRVLRNTYLLLGLTLIFSAAMAGLAMMTNAKPMNFIVLLIGMFGLSFLTSSLRNSAWGLLAIFLFTGFMGYALGPILNLTIHGFSNGAQLVSTAAGATGAIFLGLSGYVLVSKKDFSYLGGFIAIAIIGAFILGVGAMLFNLTMLSLVVSAAFVLISSAYILYMTSQVVNGGERNYIMATITLYMAIFNLFVSLLNLLSAFAGGSRN